MSVEVYTKDELDRKYAELMERVERDLEVMRTQRFAPPLVRIIDWLGRLRGAWKTSVPIHDVVRGEHCYYCTKCHAAAGDGDGFVGQPCRPNDQAQ